MVYTEVREVNGRKYYYRVLSIRENKKTSKKRIYLGSDLNKKNLVEKEKNADEKLVGLKGKGDKKIKNLKGLKKIKSKLVRTLKKNNVKKAGVFGSYSRGEERDKSDIDIVVELNDKTMSLIGFISLLKELEKKLNKKVDLVEYGSLHPRIKKRVLNEEVRVI